MTEEQRDWLRRRIQQLQSRMKRVGPFRQAGIYRTIRGLRTQLRNNKWEPVIGGKDA